MARVGRGADGGAVGGEEWKSMRPAGQKAGGVAIVQARPEHNLPITYVGVRGGNTGRGKKMRASGVCVCALATPGEWQARWRPGQAGCADSRSQEASSEVPLRR